MKISEKDSFIMNFWDEIKIWKINLIYLRNAYSWMFKFLQFLFYTNVQWIWANNSRRFFFPLARTATRLLIQRCLCLIAPRYKSGSSRTFASSFLFIRKEECLVDRRVAASKTEEKGIVATATFALSRKL